VATAKAHLSAAGAEVAEIEGFGVVVGVGNGEADAEAGPLFGDDDAVLGVAGLVADGAGEAGADLGGVEHGAHVGDVLGALVVHAADAVVEHEHGEGAAVFCLYLADIEQHAVNQAARLYEKEAAGAFKLLGGGALAHDQPHRDAAHKGQQNQPGGDLPLVGVVEAHSYAGHHPKVPTRAYRSRKQGNVQVGTGGSRILAAIYLLMHVE